MQGIELGGEKGENMKEEMTEKRVIIMEKESQERKERKGIEPRKKQPELDSKEEKVEEQKTERDYRNRVQDQKVAKLKQGREGIEPGRPKGIYKQGIELGKVKLEITKIENQLRGRNKDTEGEELESPAKYGKFKFTPRQWEDIKHEKDKDLKGEMIAKNREEKIEVKKREREVENEGSKGEKKRKCL